MNISYSIEIDSACNDYRWKLLHNKAKDSVPNHFLGKPYVCF